MSSVFDRFAIDFSKDAKDFLRLNLTPEMIVDDCQRYMAGVSVSQKHKPEVWGQIEKKVIQYYYKLGRVGIFPPDIHDRRLRAESQYKRDASTEAIWSLWKKALTAH